MPIVADLNALYPTECPVVLSVRQKHIGWRMCIANRYISYSKGSIDKLYEHRLVAQDAYGAIPNGYHVHHIDRDSLNNQASNLIVLDRIAHIHAHHPQLVVYCDYCNRIFNERPSQYRKSNKHYCGVPCRNLADRKVTRPDKEQLIELLNTLNNWCAIGQMFGVSDNAVRKWAKAYGLPIKRVRA